MKTRGTALGGALLVAALTSVPAHGWQVSHEEHAAQQTPSPEANKMAGMKAMDTKASNAKLDELVAKMNAAQGQVKVDAIAELLTTLVRQHQGMHGDMGRMMSTMKDAGAAK